jgi:hypothetical protein
MGDTAKRKAGDDEGAKRAKRVEVKKDQGAAENTTTEKA